MADGEISEVSEAIGQLRMAVSALGTQIGSLTQQWLQQDREASHGRRVMYDKVNGLETQVTLLKGIVEQMKPLVDAGHAAALRASGVRYILKALWLGLVALVGALGATIVNWLLRPLPPHH